MKRKFIIDTDTASDDAVALMMAFRSPDVEVLAVTIVAGNVPADQGAANALYTAELCGVEAPVYIGARRPLVRRYESAEWFHGKDGMGDQHYPPAKRKPESKHAVDALIETILANPGVVLVTLGPLTNIALALSRAPEIVKNVSRCVVMGGAACTYGNVTPAAEYNIFVDPEAARIVFLSGMSVEMVGWEFCRDEFALSMEEIDALRALDTPFAHFTVDCNRAAIAAYFVQNKQHGMALPDPVAMSVALDPSICTHSSKHYVEVELSSELTRGMTVVDRLDVAGDERNRLIWQDAIAREARIRVCWQLDVARWKALLLERLK